MLRLLRPLLTDPAVTFYLVPLNVPWEHFEWTAPPAGLGAAHDSDRLL